MLVEPLSVAVNAVRLTCGDSILNGLWKKDNATSERISPVFIIYGDGPIGLLSLVAVKALYKLTYSINVLVIVVGATEERLKKAKSLGAGFQLVAIVSC